MNKHPLAWWTENGPRQDNSSWAYQQAHRRNVMNNWFQEAVRIAIECNADMMIHDQFTFSGPDAEKNRAEFERRVKALEAKYDG
jgi:hypothetical protein